MKFLLEAVLGEHDGVLPVVHGRLPTGLVHGIKPADLLGQPGRQLGVLGLEGLETIPTLEDEGMIDSGWRCYGSRQRTKRVQTVCYSGILQKRA